MKEIILVKNGEISLKGLNRNAFENILLKNIKLSLDLIGNFKYSIAQSTIYIEPLSNNIDLSLAVSKLNKIFGIAGICRTLFSEKNLNSINLTTLNYIKTNFPFIKSFKIESKRSDKKFPLKSPEISKIVGGFILNNLPNLKVDLHNPDLTIYIEVRDFGTYIYHQQLKGSGGLPVGSSGNGMLLISGGIDSPVAGYLMAKRGLQLFCCHFFTPPFTSPRAKLKVIDLIKKLSPFCGHIRSFFLNFTEFQEAIKNNCPKELFTIIMRRYMLKISQHFAIDNSCPILITGESLAQVASQTLPALVASDSASELPIFRPLIGLDKADIINIAKKIDTYTTSIQPFEDCCALFSPKHPKTAPSINEILAAEANLANIEDDLISSIISNAESLFI